MNSGLGKNVNWGFNPFRFTYPPIFSPLFLLLFFFLFLCPLPLPAL